MPDKHSLPIVLKYSTNCCFTQQFVLNEGYAVEKGPEGNYKLNKPRRKRT